MNLKNVFYFKGEAMGLLYYTCQRYGKQIMSLIYNRFQSALLFGIEGEMYV